MGINILLNHIDLHKINYKSENILCSLFKDNNS
jgi:hypothetical protein